MLIYSWRWGRKKTLKNTIIENKLQNKVYLLGHKNNVYKYLSKSEGLICITLGRTWFCHTRSCFLQKNYINI